MSIRVVFLGTSGSVPTLKRSLPSVVVQCPREQWIFDCGENTQRQMMQAKVSFHKKLKVFLTHLHGDHVLGLPGVLQTMALMDRKEPLQVYGPVRHQGFSGLYQGDAQFRLNVSRGNQRNCGRRRRLRRRRIQCRSRKVEPCCGELRLRVRGEAASGQVLSQESFGAGRSGGRVVVETSERRGSYVARRQGG